MKKMLLGLASLIALAAPASAADLAARPYAPSPMIAALFDWSGFYIGANGGWGSSHKCWTNTAVFGAVVVPANEGCHNATGGVAGGQIGYRWQAGSWVFGVEGQGDWADLRGSNASLVNFGGGVGATSNRSKIDAFGLFTGQVGYAFDNVLLYVKGGGAVVSDKYSGYNTASGIEFDRSREIRWGGVVGVGLEYGFSPNWSAAVAYDHIFLGTRSINFSATGALPLVFSTREDRIKQDVDLVTVRVNYRWGGPVVAKY